MFARLLDDFERAAGALTSHWTTINGNAPLLDGSGFAYSSGGRAWARWDGTDAVGDQEAWATIGGTGADWNLATVRNNESMSAVNCFGVQWGAGTLLLVKVAANSPTAIDSVSLALAAGGKIGIRAIGSDLTVWAKQPDGAWTQYLEATDTSYATGKLGFQVGASGEKLAEFGGGAIVPSAGGSSGVIACTVCG